MNGVNHMKLNKRVILALIAFLIMIILAAVKYTLTRPKPISSETYIVDDGDGRSHTVTYERYDSTAGKAHDKKTYILIMTACAAFFAVAGNFQKRTDRLNAIKNRCTVPVPAVVISVTRSLHDDYIRYQRPVYNATYRYEYLGTVYEGNNRCYGLKRKTLSGKIKVGDSEEIFVNPQNPRDFFDILGEDCLKSARFNVILSVLTGIASYVMLMIN